jgi:hypothetical protein
MSISMAATKKPNPIDIHVGGRVRLRRGTNRIGASRLQNIASVLSVPVGFFFDGAPGPGEAGAADSKSGSYVVDFLSSSEGLQLNRAFVRISDPRIRRRVVDLVRALAGDATEN